MDYGITEADRRSRGDFDGLLGGLDPDNEESILLRDIFAYLRDYLLDRYSDDEARDLPATFEPRPGYRNMPVVDDDVLLAIDLLNMFRSAMRTSEVKHTGWPTFSELLFGKAGITGRKVRAPFEKSNADRSADSGARVRKLQRDAAAKWAESQHAHKSATEIAKLIDPDHWSTTRRKIKRR